MSERYSMFTAADRPAMNRLRRKARKLDMRLEKSRQSYHSGNRGGFMLLCDHRGVLEGVSYELDLSAAERWIDFYAARSGRTD